MQELNVLLSSQRYKHSSGIFESLNSRAYAVIKGEPLSMLAYGSYGKRHLGDIDLLIDRKDLKCIETIFANNGFTTTLRSRADRIMLLSSSHQTAPYIKNILPYKSIVIDVNFDVFWGEYDGKHIYIKEFLSDVIEQEIYGCIVKTLTPLKTMIQLILHQYKDMNSLYILFSRGSYNIGGLKDIYHLLVNNLNDISLNKLLNISEKYSVVPFVYYILYHVGILYNDDIINYYIKAFETFEGKQLLNCYGLNASERHEWNVDIFTRLKSKNLNNLIRNSFSEKEKQKMELNRRIF